MLKHAFLIIAHNEFDLLEEQIKLLDHQNNYLFIHIDKKVNNYDLKRLYQCVHKSYLDVCQEISVLWGDSSQMKCEMLLLKKAFLHQCDYYHFMSGVDLPLKHMDVIHDFFEKNNGKEFIHFDSKKIEERALDRVAYRHFFSGYLKRYKSKLITKGMFLLDRFCVLIQKVLRIKKDLPYSQIQKGCNWCSITKALAEEVVSSENIVDKLLDKSLCGDEVFVQTVCVNSNYVDNLYNSDFDNNYEACTRLIIWDEVNKRTPRTFAQNDIELLRNSNCMFGRKFSLDKQYEFTKKWIEEIKERQNENRNNYISCVK